MYEDDKAQSDRDKANFIRRNSIVVFVSCGHGSIFTPN